MAKLVNARKISTFAGKMLIKGYSTVLVPPRRHQGVVTWHAISSSDGSYISYSDAAATYRHIVGWSVHVDNYAGAPGANYDIGWSKLSKPDSGGAFDKVSIVAGTHITVGLSCVLGKKDKPVHLRGRDDYIRRLKWISKKFVILYDTTDNRAWLVDGASALLHLVRASLKRDTSDDFETQFLYDKCSMQEAVNAGTGRAASIDGMDRAIIIDFDSCQQEGSKLGTKSQCATTGQTYRRRLVPT
ncbi:uncharacterized protein HRG_07734 [Hirsutella rhossiliensis]|uniref:Uncharacterized protein n=1 Tax=Hirsutella rhossiliensis TaxID=111463 RepID=A0A9P8SI48_9HYPO|nr:uncharacterized protein HRG_07734 [Hirsutella rhossiliensis]KAH0961656.1 hypothetical protein HRG_07734 [Hirsutella rhossiliensis]